MPAPNLFNEELDKLFAHGAVDFAHCGVATQVGIIEKVAGDNACRDQLLELNPWINDVLKSETGDAKLISQNADVVRTNYSVANCGRMLMEIYITGWCKSS